MLSEYQLKIDDLYNIPIGNVKKLVPNFFDKEKKYVIDYENLKLYLRLGLKLNGKTMENLSKWIDVKVVSNKKRLFKMYIKTNLYVAQNIWQ